MKTRVPKSKIQYVYNWKNIKTYTIEYIFQLIKDKPKNKWYFDDENIKIKLRRIKLFYYKGTDCVKCDSKGTHFSLREDAGGGMHVDLYGYNKDGIEVLINRDHILPKSRGGEDTINNMQPTCMVCNSMKGNYTESELQDIELQKD